MTCSRSRECAFSTARAPASRDAQVRARIRSLKSGRSKASARRRSALGSKRGDPDSKRRMAATRSSTRLALEEEPGRGLAAARRHHGLERAALPQRDHRAARGHRLERRDAEVLERREDQRAAARVELRRLGVVAPAEELDRRARQGAKPSPPRARCRRRRDAARGGWPPRRRGRRACTASARRPRGRSRPATRRRGSARRRPAGRSRRRRGRRRGGCGRPRSARWRRSGGRPPAVRRSQRRSAAATGGMSSRVARPARGPK